jgi:hypothetical protein
MNAPAIVFVFLIKEFVQAVGESVLKKKSETTADQPWTDAHTCNKRQPPKEPVTHRLLGKPRRAH